MKRPLLLLSLTALALSACQALVPVPAPTVTPSPTATATATPTPRPTPTSTPLPPLKGMGQAPAEASEPVLAAARDLQQLLELEDLEAIEVVSVKAVDWPDTSLGCPEEGMMYAQVITPGYLVVLGVEGEEYQYHTDTAGRVVLCVDEPGR